MKSGCRRRKIKMNNEEARFVSIGTGFVGQKNEQSPKYIRLKIDAGVKEEIPDDSFSGGIFIFKTDKVDKNKNPIYNIMAKMPATYEKESKLV